jgi:hypothetical protein
MLFLGFWDWISIDKDMLSVVCVSVVAVAVSYGNFIDIERDISAVWVCVVAGTLLRGNCIDSDRDMLSAVSICVVDGTVLYRKCSGS